MILGVDASLNSTGICLLPTGEAPKELFTIKNKTVKKKLEHTGAERLVWIRNRVKRVIVENKPDAIFIEGYALHSKGNCTYQLGELGGVLRVLFYECGVPYFEVDPKTLKKDITGNGSAKKSLMLQFAITQFGVDKHLPFNDDDKRVVVSFLKKQKDASKHLHTDGCSIFYHNEKVKHPQGIDDLVDAFCLAKYGAKHWNQ